MFSEQFTRQLSTSPPPFSSCAPIPSTESSTYANYQPFCALPSAGWQTYPATSQHTFATHNITSPPIKQEIFGDDDYNNPFSMSYASMANEHSYPAYVSRQLPPYPLRS
jgi:hypothetical protein